jgi:hypothetical protein
MGGYRKKRGHVSGICSSKAKSDIRIFNELTRMEWQDIAAILPRGKKMARR